MKSFALSLTIVGLIALTVLAQTTAGGGGGGFSGSVTLHPPSGPSAVITGAPYSAEQAVERTQTLADGTHITQEPQITRLYRDSQGRTRTERPMFYGPRAPADLSMVEIRDPVAGYAYSLDSENRVAHRFKLAGFSGGSGPNVARSVEFAGSTAATSAKVAPSQPAERPQFSRESLGMQVVEGVTAQGSRVTTTYPIGMVGNDRPFSSTSETWTSPELKTVILMKNTDPRNGEYTSKLTNISRAEPDASLFQPPSDYTVQDETGPITITVKRP